MTTAFFAQLLHRVRTGGTVLLSGISGACIGQCALAGEADEVLAEAARLCAAATLPCTVATAAGEVFCERLLPRPRLILCGGGHIALPLASIGALLDFDVTVIDDRSDFANTSRFPMAHTVLCQPFDTALGGLTRTAQDYFVIITRGHKDDRLCLTHILDGPFAYAGMIGSRSKVAVVREQMAQDGTSKALLERVHAPIGLRIGAQTPAEIAVCIAAEVIQERAAQPTQSEPFEEALFAALAQGQRGMLAVVIDKKGSAPRGVGARLLADTAGRLLFGTVGGGAGEAAVLAAAASVCAAGAARVLTCSMTNEDARQDGMVCGGTLRVLLLPIGR